MMRQGLAGWLEGLEANRKRNLWVLLGGALVLRVLAVVLAPTWYTTDSYSYRAMAHSILDGSPSDHFPNGLPLLEAGLIWVLGEGMIYGLLGLQVLVSVVSCWLVYAIGRKYGGSATGWLAALVMMVYPFTISFVRLEMTETVSVFLLLGALWLLMCRRYGWAGVVFGLLWLFRSSLLPTGLLLGVALLPFGNWRAWRPVLGFVGGFLVVWALNWGLIQGGVLKAPVNLGENLLLSIQARSTEGMPFDGGGVGAAELEDPWGAYWEFLCTQPGEWMMQRLSSLWELMGPWPSAGVGESQRWMIARGLIGLRFLMLLGALGAVWRYRKERYTWWLAAPAVGVAGLHFFFFSDARFWVPVEPCLMVLMAAWVVRKVASSQ